MFALPGYSFLCRQSADGYWYADIAGRNVGWLVAWTDNGRTAILSMPR